MIRYSLQYLYIQKCYLVDDPLDQIKLSLQRGVQEQGQGVKLHPHAVVDPLGAGLTQVGPLPLVQTHGEEYTFYATSHLGDITQPRWHALTRKCLRVFASALSGWIWFVHVCVCRIEQSTRCSYKWVPIHKILRNWMQCINDSNEHPEYLLNEYSIYSRLKGPVPSATRPD